MITVILLRKKNVTERITLQTLILDIFAAKH